MQSPVSLAETLCGEKLDPRDGKRDAFIALAHSICSRWIVPNDVRITLVRDSRSSVSPLLDDMDPIVGPAPKALSRWQRLGAWLRKRWGWICRRPVIVPSEIPPIHEEMIQLEAWGCSTPGFYHSSMVGYGPESNMLAWTGMKSVPG